MSDATHYGFELLWRFYRIWIYWRIETSEYSLRSTFSEIFIDFIKKCTTQSFCICFLSNNVGIPSEYQVPKRQIGHVPHKSFDSLFFPLQFWFHRLKIRKICRSKKKYDFGKKKSRKRENTWREVKICLQRKVFLIIFNKVFVEFGDFGRLH